MELVSIIVPVYNVEPYLAKCLSSILSQSFSAYELILVDDGSTDGSPAICDEYAKRDPRIRVIHQENTGVSCARNRGLDAALGTCVTFCDSDDSLEPDWLQRLVEALESGNTDSAAASFTVVDAADAVIYRKEHLLGTFSLSSTREKLEYILFKVLSGSIGWEITTRLFRRSIIENHHLRFCQSCENFAEDLGFVVQYLLYAKSEVSVACSGYHYFMRSGSMMDSSRQTVKLNQVNEVSKFLYPAFVHVFSSRRDRRYFSLLHAELIYNQMVKLRLQTDSGPGQKAFAAVSDQTWMRRKLFGILGFAAVLKRHFGKRAAWTIILLSHYAMHQSFFLFRAERSFINRRIVYIQ